MAAYTNLFWGIAVVRVSFQSTYVARTIWSSTEEGYFLSCLSSEQPLRRNRSVICALSYTEWTFCNLFILFFSFAILSSLNSNFHHVGKCKHSKIKRYAETMKKSNHKNTGRNNRQKPLKNVLDSARKKLHWVEKSCLSICNKNRGRDGRFDDTLEL